MKRTLVPFALAILFALTLSASAQLLLLWVGPGGFGGTGGPVGPCNNKLDFSVPCNSQYLPGLP